MIDINKAIGEIEGWIKDWFSDKGDTAVAVIGISGGKDSTVCAKLLADALGKDRVIGVMMPNGTQADIEHSKAVIDLLGIRGCTVNIGGAYKALTGEVEKGFGINPVYTSNTPARLRMAALYGIAATVGGYVCNTCNLSEDWVGYSTKWGDCVGDFSLLNKLTKTEVVMLGDALGLPEYLVHKVPSDGMCGKSDEDNLGFTYDELDEYIRSQTRMNVGWTYDSVPKLPAEVVAKIDRMHFHPNTRKKCVPLDSPLERMPGAF